MRSTARWLVLPAGRRWGKSEFGVMWMGSACRDDALRGVEGVSWIIAPTYDLLKPIWRKFHRILPKSWITAKYGTENQPGSISIGPALIEFRSGERPERLVAEGIRRWWADEAGTIKRQVIEESVLPAGIDHKAPGLLSGTPKGRNLFHEWKVKGEDPNEANFYTFGGSSYCNPFIDSDEIDMIASSMPERVYRQEIMAEFLEDEGAVFRRIRDAVQHGGTSSAPTVVIGVDLGRHQDFTVLHGLDENGRTTHWERFRDVSWPLQKRRIIAAAKKTDALVVIDATHGSVGDPIAEELEERGLRVYPFQFTASTKRALVDGLSIAIEQALIGLPDEPILHNELEIFEYEITPAGNVKYHAPEGLHDDAVMACALAWYGYDERMSKRIKLIEPVHYGYG